MYNSYEMLHCGWNDGIDITQYRLIFTLSRLLHPAYGMDDIKRCCDPPICLSVCPMPQHKTVHFKVMVTTEH